LTKKQSDTNECEILDRRNNHFTTKIILTVFNTGSAAVYSHIRHLIVALLAAER